MSHTFQRNNRNFITGLTVSDAESAPVETFGYALNNLGQRIVKGVRCFKLRNSRNYAS